MSEHTAEFAQVRTITVNDRLPSLHIPWPQCGHCGEDVTIEDGAAWCDGCLIQWDRIEEDSPGKPDEGREDTDVPCKIVVGRQGEPHADKRGNHYVPGPPRPCILPSGHEGEHLCPYDVEVSSSPGESS
ncbi:hypothetical protein [Nocardioides sp. URHA0032]|uniref:hypothetical protein n=1 Tax=Nocardioides sp. URHA0032 TaxID=1380388 RepID=UPI00048D2A92|nr:hypothetical protein [Nocardioides sp. URHA0032]